MNKYHFIRKERFLDAIPISALKTFYFFTFRFERWIFRFEHYIYVILKLIIIIYYVPKVFSFISTLRRSLKEWEEKMRNEYINQ